MKVLSEDAAHKAAHDLTMEFLRRNAPPPLPEGASYVLSTSARLNALVDDYLDTYRKVAARLSECQHATNQ